MPQKSIGKQLLPWFNTALWELMKKRDVALKKSLKSGLETDRLIYKSYSSIKKGKGKLHVRYYSTGKGESTKTVENH